MTDHSRANSRHQRLWSGILIYLLLGASVNLLIGYLRTASAQDLIFIQNHIEATLKLFRPVFHLLVLAWLARTARLPDLLHPFVHDHLVQQCLTVGPSDQRIRSVSVPRILGLGMLLSLPALLLFPDQQQDGLSGLADAGEEIIFRGVLLGLLIRSLRNTPASRWIAVILSAALFSAAHTFYFLPEPNLERLSTIFILGTIFAILRLATASLAVPVFFHGYFNGGLFGGCVALLVYVVFLMSLTRRVSTSGIHF